MSIPPFQALSGKSRQKQALVIDWLFRLAQQHEVGDKLPTSRELARTLGISGATLGRSLAHLEKRRVLRCVQGSGIYVNSGVTQKQVALVFGKDIFSSESSGFGTLILKHSALRARDHNERFSFYLDFHSSHGVMDGQQVPVHQDLVDALQDKRIDGIILIAQGSSEQEAWLRGQGVPVVLAEANQEDHSSDSSVVYLDYHLMIERGVERLAQEGCETIGLIGIFPEHSDIFRKSLSKRGLAIHNEWIHSPAVKVPHAQTSHIQFGVEAGRQLLSLREKGVKDGKSGVLPDGILLTDDAMSKAVLSLLTSHRVRIGKDLKVCSHANKGDDTLVKWENKISRIMFDPADIVTALFETLEALMDGKTQNSPRLIGPVLDQED